MGSLYDWLISKKLESLMALHAFKCISEEGTYTALVTGNLVLKRIALGVVLLMHAFVQDS